MARSTALTAKQKKPLVKTTHGQRPPKSPSTPTATPETTPQDEAQYLALKARDARFDGRFFTGVTSTGIYCRPVCKVRTPKRENCRFFSLAAQAEAAGFRPCLRCRPELAPGTGHDFSAAWSTQDATSVLAHQAASHLLGLIRNGEGSVSMAALAQHMGVTDRHLRRIFAAHWGISPLQYVQTHRLLNAKQLLTDTQLPVSQIAALSGFGSLRRFHAVFVAHYRMQPLALRKALASVAVPLPAATAAAALPSHNTATSTASPPLPSKRHRRAVPGALELRLGYRPPYDVAALLGFLQMRAVEGLESVDLTAQTWARTLALPYQQTRRQGWVQARFVPAENYVALRISESLAPVLPTVLARVRAALDLDADPQPIDACLLPSFPNTEGMRVPGTVDGFELAVRAILGQQITVAAARTLTTRLVQALGEPLQQPLGQTLASPGLAPNDCHGNSTAPALDRLFPSAAAIAEAPASMLGELGIVRQRQAALIALAQAVASGDLALQPTARPEATLAQLQALPGIGPWTAQYIAMRALRWPDAFPSGDVALQNALGVRHERAPAKAAEAASAAWRPWRSYAVIRAWQTLSPRPAQGAKP